MRHIGEISAPALARIAEARERRRAERIARYGWPDSVTCAECGDTGTPPEKDTPCLACDRGRRMNAEAMAHRRWLERVPPRFQRYTLESHPNQGAVRDARAWIADREPGENLLILGPVGSGKTGLAYGILRELVLEHGADVRAGGVVDILDSLRPRDRDAREVIDPVTVHALVRVPILLLDDLAAERPTEFTAERMYAIINGRYEAERPTIFTTNVSGKEIADVYGQRALSRITERTRAIQLAGRDLRG